MSIAAISAVSGLGGAASSVFGSVAPIGGLSTGSAGSIGSTGKTGTSATGGIDFSEALGKVQRSIDDADVLSQQLATGQLTDIHEYTVAASKAQLGVQLTVAVRNQLVSAFQEVMRMQV